MATQTQTPETYVTIPESNLNRLEDQISKLNRRAAKLSLAPIEVTEVSRETRRKLVGRNSLGEDVYTSRVWVTVDVQGDKPAVPGWTLMGAIDHGDVTDGSLNVLRAGRGETVHEDYRHASPSCDHCDTTRRRRDTFILRDARGSHKQVGRNCLADFLGEGTTAAQLVGWLKFLREVEAVTSDCESDGSSRGDYEETGSYLAACVATVRVDGWTSKGKAYGEGGTATADTAWRVLYPTPFDLKQADHPKITTDDVDVAEKALAWVRSLAEGDRADGYLANLYAACARDGFRRKQAGVVASLVGAAWPRAMRDVEADRRKAADAEARREAAEVNGISEHIGAVKERLRDLDVTIEKIRGWEGHYGYTTLVAMRDGANNLLAWYATGDLADDLPAEGSACKLTGTIKRHGDDKYTGAATTYVNRCKLVA